MVVRITSWRLRDAKKSFSATSHDMVNAFGIGWQEIGQAEHQKRVDERYLLFFEIGEFPKKCFCANIYCAIFYKHHRW